MLTHLCAVSRLARLRLPLRAVQRPPPVLRPARAQAVLPRRGCDVRGHQSGLGEATGEAAAQLALAAVSAPGGFACARFELGWFE